MNYKHKKVKVKCTLCGIETNSYTLKVINGILQWVCTLHKSSEYTSGEDNAKR